MIKGFVNPLYADQMIEDLGGYEAAEDYREGVLIDSLLFYNSGNWIAFLEHPTGCDRSIYRVEMAPTETPEGKKIESYFTMSYTLD